MCSTVAVRWSGQQVLDDGVRSVAGPTRILLPDGRTRPIAELRIGDVVLGTEMVEGARRYVPTRVLAHRSTTKPAYTVRLAGGTELVTSGEHRFLTDAGWRHVGGGWCRAGRRPHLRPGSVLLGPGPFGPELPRPHTPAYRAGYLCGLVRADGPGFPSDRLRLEALGRAHHLLAEAERAGRPRQVPGSGRTGGVTVAGPGRSDDRAGTAPGRVTRTGPGRSDERASLTAGRAGAGLGRPAALSRPAGPVTVVAEPGRIARVAGAPLDIAAWPQRPGDEWCAGFLAGVVDARGEVTRGELRVVHADEEIVGRVAGALHRLGFGFAIDALPGGTRAVRLRGGPGALRRLLARTGPAVTRSLDGAPVVGSPELVVVEVRETGHATAMDDIITGTGDVVAEGVVSHSCASLHHAGGKDC